VIAYLDTSAVVPLLIDEPASPICAEIWESFDVLVSTRLVEIEAACALQQAHRLNRITRSALTTALTGLDAVMSDLDLIEITAELVVEARRCADAVPLRGYDALHCASGLAVARDPGSALVSGDRQLLAAWWHFGAEIVDVHEPAG
jgi:predicted nucleic acid-binding protein